MQRRKFLAGMGSLAAAGALTGCRRSGADRDDALVFAHGKHPRYAFLSEMVQQFEREHPGARVREVVLPSSSDEMHQFYVINLGAGADEFDIVDLDIIWVPEFARAGWLADLTAHIPAAALDPLHAAARRADTLDGKLYAVPWFVDAGVLYYRRDLLEEHGFAPPVTYPELLDQARRIQGRAGDTRLNGFIWQGLQYEGLVCAALEFIRGNGGDVLRDGRVALREPATLEALKFMDALIRRHGVTPPLVNTLNEEAARHVFQSGRAVFMRNWPYAWRLLNQPDSPVAGRVGLTVVPHFPGSASAPTLGGWHLGVNARSRHQERAVEFLKFLTSFAAQKEIIRNVGVLAAHAGVYQDADVRAALPHLPQVLPALERAQPRPVTPYYLMISQILQPELSAIVAGISSPEKAMDVAARQVEHLLGASRSGAAG